VLVATKVPLFSYYVCFVIVFHTIASPRFSVKKESWEGEEGLFIGGGPRA
jgi:hypothetical protein